MELFRYARSQGRITLMFKSQKVTEILKHNHTQQVVCV